MRLWLAFFFLLNALPGPVSFLGRVGINPAQIRPLPAGAALNPDQLAAPQLAPPGIEISDLAVDYRFGEKAVFRALVTPPGEAAEVYLFIQPQGEPARSEKISPGSDGQIEYTYDLRQKPLRPFTTIEYWLRVSVSGQEPSQSEHKFLDYEDNRFNWQKLEDNDFQVRWIDGNITFGQAVLDTARAGLRSAASYLDFQLSQPLKIYVYGRSSDLQAALLLGPKSWVAGHASPDLGVVLISVPAGPEQLLELERQLPHEIMHVLTFEITGSGYDRLPVWFMEGLASLAELNPNPDYQIALDRARESHSLVPFSSLCAAFPREASGAFLAYAESASFVRFLQENFGSTVIQDMLSNYQNGMGCEEGANSAFGSTLEQVTIRWQREKLGMDTGAMVLSNLSPYLAAGVLLLVLPLGLAILLYSFKKRQPKAV